MNPEKEYWFRAEDKRYANWDPWDDLPPLGSHLTIEIHPYLVIRHTRKGVWVRSEIGGERFILGVAAKQFAVPTIELALKDLVARKRVHTNAAHQRWQQALEHLQAAEHELKLEIERY